MLEGGDNPLWIGKTCMSQSEVMEVGTLKLGFTEVVDTFLKLRSH